MGKPEARQKHAKRMQTSMPGACQKHTRSMLEACQGHARRMHTSTPGACQQHAEEARKERASSTHRSTLGACQKQARASQKQARRILEARWEQAKIKPEEVQKHAEHARSMCNGMPNAV